VNSKPATAVQYTAYLEGSLVLTAQGVWVHNGTPFANQRLSELFSRSVVWDSQHNAYTVRIGAQQACFTCEDTPYFVMEFDPGTLQLRLSNDSHYSLALDSLRVGSSGQFYCRVAVNPGRQDVARFSRPAHQSLLAHAVDDQHLELAGKVIKLEPL